MRREDEEVLCGNCGIKFVQYIIGGMRYDGEYSEVFAQDDITIVNLECVFTDETQRVEKQFNIKGYPHYAGILSGSSVEVCSLGNNHTKDYGLASFEDTKEALEAVSVDYAYEDKVAYYETAEGIKVAMLSAHLLSEKEQTFTFVDGELTMDLDARLIPARLSGLDNANNYQPVIATGTKAQTILDNMRRYSAPLSALEIDAEGRLTIKE